MAIRWTKTSESVVDWNRQPRRTSARCSTMRVGEVAVMRDREAAELEIGIQRLHVAQDGFAGGGVAVMADGDTARAAWRSRARSPKLSPTRPMPRCEWKRAPSKLTMPVASWPRCCRACRPSAVTAAASGTFQTPKTPHSSCSLSSSCSDVGRHRYSSISDRGQTDPAECRLRSLRGGLGARALPGRIHCVAASACRAVGRMQQVVGRGAPGQRRA